MKKTLQIVFRIDDVCPSMKMRSFEAVLNLLTKFGALPCLGIIPNNKDKSICYEQPNQSFWLKIQQYQKMGCVVALHGFSHQYSSNHYGILKINKYSEFSNVDFGSQKERIKQGMDVLFRNHVNSNIFMAPAHSFDNNTLKLLKEAGIPFITDGYGTRKFRYKGIIFIPCENDYSLPKNAVGIHTLCIHPNTITPEQMKALEALLLAKKENILPFSDIINDQDVCNNIFYAKLIIIRGNFIRGIKRIYHYGKKRIKSNQ